MNTAPPSIKPPNGDSRRNIIVAGTILIMVVVMGARYFLQLDTERTEDAYVDGNAVQVTSQITGTVTAILADDTDHVAAGSALVKLNPVDQEVQYERATAALAKATREHSTTMQCNCKRNSTSAAAM